MKWRMRFLVSHLLIILFFLISGSAIADHNQYLFDQANKLYQQEKYQSAIEKYLEIRAAGYESWQLYFNLGNAYYKTRDFGRAILNFERALKLNPKDEDIRFNLDLANLTVVDKIVTPPQFIISKFLSDLKNMWGMKTLTFIAILFYLLVTALIVIKILVRRNPVQRIVNILLIPMVTLFLIIAAIFVIRIHEKNTLRYAIVLVNKIDVLGSPDDQGTELFSLHQGVKFKVEELRGDWSKIRLADGKIGWVKRSVFEII